MLFDWPATTQETIPVITLGRSRSLDFCAYRCRLNISFVFPSGEGFQASGLLGPNPHRPIIAADFLYFVGKNNMLVYLSVLIRQWCWLCPACALSRDKTDQKASDLVGWLEAIWKDTQIALRSL